MSRGSVWLAAWMAAACLSSCQHLPLGPSGLKVEHFHGRDLVEAPEPEALEQALEPTSPFRPWLQRVAQRLRGGLPVDSVHYVGLLENGEDALLARLHLIEHARRSVEFQTFIWRNDESGQLLARTLIAAARRGVKVRVLVDYVGIAKDAEALAVFAGAHPNLEVRVYRPTARTLEKGHVGTILYALTNFKGANQRMHNKVMVVDDAVGITGGRNVENSYFNHALGMNFKDRDALVLGPAAISMAEAFDAFWDYHHTVPAEALRDVARWKGKAVPPAPASTAVERRLARLAQQAQRAASVEARLVSLLRPVASLEFVSDLPGKNGALLLNGGGRATAHVLRALDEAEEELWIQSPYLVLESMGMNYFKRLRKAKPELRIRVSTNSFGSTDNLVAYAGNVRSRDRYVNQLGFRIGEYRAWPRDLRKVLPQFDWLKGQAREGGDAVPERPPFVCIHAKSFVADQSLAFVGSFNLDPRSAHLNTECGLLIRDRALAQELKAEIQRDLDPRNCWVIAPRHGNKPLLELQMLSRELTDLSPVDLSIFDASTAYGLKPGVEPVEWEDARFFERFRDVGSFPGVQGRMSDRELMGRLLKLSTPLMDPLL